MKKAAPSDGGGQVSRQGQEIRTHRHHSKGQNSCATILAIPQSIGKANPALCGGGKTQVVVTEEDGALDQRARQATRAPIDLEIDAGLDAVRVDQIARLAELAASYWHSIALAADRGERLTVVTHCRQVAAATRNAFAIVRTLGSEEVEL